jgi:hypothetical protein
MIVNASARRVVRIASCDMNSSTGDEGRIEKGVDVRFCPAHREWVF